MVGWFFLTRVASMYKGEQNATRGLQLLHTHTRFFYYIARNHTITYNYQDEYTLCCVLCAYTTTLSRARNWRLRSVHSSVLFVLPPCTFQRLQSKIFNKILFFQNMLLVWRGYSLQVNSICTSQTYRSINLL